MALGPSLGDLSKLLRSQQGSESRKERQIEIGTAKLDALGMKFTTH